LKESVETVREIVEEARVVKPLDNALNNACQYTKLSQKLLEYVIGTCPKSFNERDNKAPSTPVTRKKQVTFSDKPGTLSSNTHKHEVHQKVQQTNILVIPFTGVNASTEASRSKPRSNTKKSKKFSHRPKSENTNMKVLHILHMDLCGPMRVQSIKGKKYILVIVGLNKTVRFICTDNGTEFVNQVMSEYYEGVGIFHQKSIPKTPQQNGVVERRNRTLVEAACTMMIFSKAPMFLWAEAVATACYT
ncbi:putative ribonuclease H-like domain-containing protein, partial [Tanacetum coccineum]